MRRHAKASSVGSTQRRAGALGRIFRPGLTARASAPDADGSSALSAARLFVLGVLLVGLFLALAPIASAFRGYESQITEANSVEFGEPEGLTVDDEDNLWVTDLAGPGVGTLSKFDSSGAYLTQSTGAGGWNASPYIESLAFGESAGLIYVADSNLDDVWGANPADATYAGVDLKNGYGGGCCFISVAVDNSGGADDGDVYVAIRGQGYVVRNDGADVASDFTASTPYITANKLEGTPDHTFGSELRDIAVDANGDIYVVDATNNEVDQFDSTGAFVRAYTGSFGSIKSVAVDPTNGNVLIGDGLNQVVHEFDSTGAFIEDIDGAATPDESFAPERLAVDSTGRLYVADGLNKVVDVFSAFVLLRNLTIDKTGSGDGSFECDTGSGFGACAPSYADGTTITIKATPNSHSTFTGWSGGCSGTGDCVVSNIAADTTRSAAFAQIKPTVSDEEAGAISQHAATLSGKVNPLGAATTCQFEWGASAAYGAVAPCTSSPGAGEAPVAVSAAALTGLVPNTTYHYRLVATNSGGTTNGTDHTFTTSADTCATNAALCPQPPVITPPVTTPPVVTPPTTKKPPIKKCKKGFKKKKKVNGKIKCVKRKAHKKGHRRR